MSSVSYYKQILTNIFSNHYSDNQIKDIICSLDHPNEDINAIIGFTQVMKEHAKTVNAPNAIDICGTGGSGKDRFNISTAAAFILASGGVGIAKHGNNGSKKPNGSFDFLDALQINYSLTINEIETQYKNNNICFLFAKNHHKAMKAVASARKEIKTRTIFNLIGPLSNPANVSYQLIGTTNRLIGDKLAQASQKLGTKRTLIIIGSDGLDELSITHKSTIIDVTQTNIKTYEFNPEKLTYSNKSTFSTFTSVTNAEFFLDIITNKITDDIIIDHICINAGAGFYLSKKTQSIEEGYHYAKEIIRSGKVFDLIKTLQQ